MSAKESSGTGRALKARVKTARKRSLASTLWLERQLNDPYVARAKPKVFDPAPPLSSSKSMPAITS